MTRETGDRAEQSSIRRAVRAQGEVFRCGGRRGTV
jgi:hypothetical protein